MKTVWTKGLEPDHAKEISGDFKSSLLIRKRLAEILEGKAKGAERVSRSKEAYDNPNWAYMQADTVGYKRALYEIMALLEE